MAEYHSLQYWLESINLPQYYTEFVNHGLISREQCAILDEQSLTNIGVTLPGHQRRILSHLPDKDNWIEDNTTLPNLPPKRKSIRDSFLYEDRKSLSSLNLQTDNAGNEASPDSTVISPRPVPKPRQRSSHLKSPATTPSEEKPKPVKRPTPAPRNLTSPKSGNKDSVASLPDTGDNVSSDKEEEKTCKNNIAFENRTFSHKRHADPDSARDVKIQTAKSQNTELKKFNDSVKLEGVCLYESSTDEYTISDACSSPVERVETEKDVEKSERVSDLYSFPVKNKSREPCDSQKAKSEELYVNLEGNKHNAPDIPVKNVTRDVAGAYYVNTSDNTESFENAEYDPMLGIYKLKEEETVYRSDIPEASNTVHNKSKPLPSNSPEPNGAQLSPNDDIYEPIWEGKREESVWKVGENRGSSLMQFSPLKKEGNAVMTRPKDKRAMSQTEENRISSFGSRKSASFDMPPPQFAPPPLPPSLSMKDVIDDFDPLIDSTKSSMPPVPPRPSNYTPPQMFKPYENLPHPMGAESSTLPGHVSDIEPEMPINSSTTANYQDAVISGADDPFKYQDPFGQFEPDYGDFDPASFQPSACNMGGQKSFNNAGKPVDEDAIYEVAEDPDDFDPFGLNQKQSQTSLPRSISSGSNGSQFRLSEVPPAPKWFSATPETNRMYSVAGNLNEGDSSSNGSIEDILDDNTRIDDGSVNMMSVDILPTTSLSARKKEKSGYLYKQGGVKQNRGWRKRWVIFDGNTLRYYSNAKDQVSKRIVPVSCMTNVEMDVKDRPLSRMMISSSDFFPNNSKQFKFKLHCTNRVFLFATDNLDDCKIWSNTLMVAIINYKAPEGGEVPGGNMAKPDIDGWIKINKNRYKFYVVLKKHRLCYYQNADDYKMASPLHEIDMKLSSVKEVDRTKLQLNTHYSTFLLNFESSSDASNWKMAIEEAITDALGDNSILDQVKENPDNRICADCGAPDAHWASMNLGIVLCLHCAGIHRGFDPRLSRIRSLRMDTRVWNSSLIEMFKEIGNDNANNFWLRNMPPGVSIYVDTNSEARKQHIHNKYKDKIYCDKHPKAETKQQLNEALIQAAQTDDVLLTYQILMSGADVLYSPPEHPNSTAFEMAKEAHQRIQMEFLLQNGGDKTKNFMPGSEEASLVAKRRAEVQLQGYLQKTGSNMKALLHVDDFLKRWCVLEHGHLSYYVSEESKVEKDRIDNESMLCIQAVHNEKHAACFEISTKKNNRVYLFAAASEEERLQWMQYIAQVFCPVDLMDQIRQASFSLAGYAHLKTGFNREWQRTWFMLEDRKLIFIDKEETEREQDSLDLRKVGSIIKISQSQTACETCLENSGTQLVLKASGDRTLYFQADLVKDTERIFAALEPAIKKGGDMLEEQALTNSDIPIIISACIDFIEQHGLRMDGLYRKADQESKIKALLQSFQDDARSVVLRVEEESVHLVCNVLKRFLRNLKDPLLTAHLYKRWIQTAGESDHNIKLRWYKYLLQQLPRINYLTLKCLACHLSKLSKHADENLMNLNNISIAFGSTLMKSDKEECISVSASGVGSAMQLEMKVISDIVTYSDWLFDIKDDERKTSIVEDKIREAQRKMEEINRNRTTEIHSNDMIIFVYYRDPKGNAESVKINKDTTAADVVHSLTTKLHLTESWTLYELIKTDLERPLHPDTMVWPLVYEWQNWSNEYSAAASLCLKSSDLWKKLEQAHDPSKPLFAEMKYCEKKKFQKMAFEFTQAKLSCYKDTKNVSNPSGSWNIEDLSIYKGCDSKKSPPTKFVFTIIARGDRIGEKEMPYFGRAVCCTTEQDLMSWMSGLIMAQHPGRYS